MLDETKANMEEFRESECIEIGSGVELIVNLNGPVVH